MVGVNASHCATIIFVFLFRVLMRIYGNQTVINGTNMAARFISNFNAMSLGDPNDRNNLIVYYPPDQTGVRALNLFALEDELDGVEALHPGSRTSDGVDPTMYPVLIGVYEGVCVLACMSMCVCVYMCVWPIIKLRYLW